MLITGATAGIGEALAWSFAEVGCKLILVGRREGRLEKLKHDLQMSHPGCRVCIMPCDVGDCDHVAALPSLLPDEVTKGAQVASMGVIGHTD